MEVTHAVVLLGEPGTEKGSELREVGIPAIGDRPSEILAVLALEGQ